MATSGNRNGHRDGSRGNDRDTRGNGRDTRGNGRSGGSGQSKKALSKKRKARKRRRIIMFVAEITVLVVLGVVLWVVLKQDKIQRIKVNEENLVFNDTVEENMAMDGYRNIALFGIDARNDELGKGNRSDSIIIASINQSTGDVKLCSVYRDTYLNMANDTYNKANAAYAKGGPEQAMNMLNMNLDLNITEFVTIGFVGLIDVIDALGGVEVDVHQEEIKFLNDYQRSMFSTETKERLTDDYVKVTNPGLQTLNGMQATAYCRIRGTKGDDFRRAERQRTVLMACLEKAKAASPSTLNKILDSTLSHVATNLNTQEMISVLSDLAKYNIVESGGFPFEDYRTTGRIGSKGSCVMPVDLEVNVVMLHKFLFGESENAEAGGYKPSDQVKAYSAKISSDTGQYAK